MPMSYTTSWDLTPLARRSLKPSVMVRRCAGSLTLKLPLWLVALVRPVHEVGPAGVA